MEQKVRASVDNESTVPRWPREVGQAAANATIELIKTKYSHRKEVVKLLADYRMMVRVQ